MSAARACEALVMDHTMKKLRQCRNPAEENSRYCHVHQSYTGPPIVERTASGSPAHTRASPSPAHASQTSSSSAKNLIGGGPGSLAPPTYAERAGDTHDWNDDLKDLDDPCEYVFDAKGRLKGCAIPHHMRSRYEARLPSDARPSAAQRSRYRALLGEPPRRADIMGARARAAEVEARTDRDQEHKREEQYDKLLSEFLEEDIAGFNARHDGRAIFKRLAAAIVEHASIERDDKRQEDRLQRAVDRATKSLRADELQQDAALRNLEELKESDRAYWQALRAYRDIEQRLAHDSTRRAAKLALLHEHRYNTVNTLAAIQGIQDMLAYLRETHALVETPEAFALLVLAEHRKQKRRQRQAIHKAALADQASRRHSPPVSEPTATASSR